MKERFIQEITNSMAEFLDIEQLATLNGVLLQAVSKYTITAMKRLNKTLRHPTCACWRCFWLLNKLKVALLKQPNIMK